MLLEAAAAGLVGHVRHAGARAVQVREGEAAGGGAAQPAAARGPAAGRLARTELPCRAEAAGVGIGT